MTDHYSLTLERTQAQVWKYGNWSLTTGLVLSLALVIAVGITAPDAVIFAPGALLGLVAIFWLLRRPILGLSAALLGFALIADFQEGFQVSEIVYGIYYATFLFVWYFRKLFIYREHLVRSSSDVLVALILVWVVLYGLLSFLYPGSPGDVFYGVQAWSMLAFYFPVKEACSLDSRGAKILLLILVVVGLFVVSRNMVTLAHKLSEATVAWEITRKGRVVTNEMLMLVPAFGILAVTLVVDSLVKKALLFSLFMILLFGLIMTQGRGYWLAFAFGSVALLIFLRGPQRLQLVTMGLLGIAACVMAILVVFGDKALLLAAGLWTRLLSIGSAASKDVSLINRFLEWKSSLSDIMANPIMGYGMARKIRYFDITISGTRTRTWIHNGYIGVWYQFGLVGLISVVSLVLISIRNGFRVTRARAQDRFRWSAATMAAASLSAMLISTIASNAWFHSDTILYLGIASGIAAGCYERLAADHPREVR